MVPDPDGARPPSPGGSAGASNSHSASGGGGNSSDGYQAQVFHDKFPTHMFMLGFCFVCSLVWWSEERISLAMPTQLSVLLCFAALVGRLALHRMTNQLLARKLGLVVWLGLLYTQSVFGLLNAIRHPINTILSGPQLMEGERTSLHMFHIFAFPLLAVGGLCHGSLGMRWWKSVLTGMPFAIKCAVSYVLHNRNLMVAASASEARSGMFVVVSAATMSILCFHIGQWIAHDLDRSHRLLWEEQRRVQELLAERMQIQAERMQQLECEKERIAYDLCLSQHRLSSLSPPEGEEAHQPDLDSASRASIERCSTEGDGPGGVSKDGMRLRSWSRIAEGLVADGLIVDHHATAAAAADHPDDPAPPPRIVGSGGGGAATGVAGQPQPRSMSCINSSAARQERADRSRATCSEWWLRADAPSVGSVGTNEEIGQILLPPEERAAVAEEEGCKDE